VSISELEPIKTGSRTWQVTVNSLGEFRANTDGLADVTASSYKALVDQAKVKASQARVSVDVPYVRFTHRGGSSSSFRSGGDEKPHTVHGTATGIHGSNGNVLARENGKPQQLSYSLGEYYRPFEAGDEARYLEIMATMSALHAERQALTQKYAFKNGLKRHVQAAVDAAVAASAEGGDEDAQDHQDDNGHERG